MLHDTTNTLIRYDTCSPVHLIKDCDEKFQVRLSRNRQTFVCDARIFSSVLPKSVVVGQNEDFIVHILLNTFDVTHKNHCIISLEVTKSSTSKINSKISDLKNVCPIRKDSHILQQVVI